MTLSGRQGEYDTDANTSYNDARVEPTKTTKDSFEVSPSLVEVFAMLSSAGREDGTEGTCVRTATSVGRSQRGEEGVRKLKSECCCCSGEQARPDLSP